LVLLFKGFVAFVFVTIVYKDFSISTKLRSEPVAKETLI
jgi:hypothetical protein